MKKKHLRRVYENFNQLKNKTKEFSPQLASFFSLFTQQKTHKRLVMRKVVQSMHTVQRFQACQQMNSSTSQVYFYANWWFRRVTELLTCTTIIARFASWAIFSDTLLVDRELNLIMFS